MRTIVALAAVALLAACANKEESGSDLRLSAQPRSAEIPQEQAPPMEAANPR